MPRDGETSGLTPTLLIGGRPVDIRIRRHGRASRISLRIDLRDGAVVLVLPPDADERQGLAFARTKADWLSARLAAVPARIPFADGTVLPLAGEPHTLRHTPLARRGVWVEGGTVFVSGQAEHMPRRVSDWLKQRAREAICAEALPMAAALDAKVARIALGDPRSRWGSCNSRGHLGFSWRLVLAPPPVLRYVVAHEVAHLRQLNHSPAFWRLVGTLMPEAQQAREWLKCHGGALHRYG
jgi:predicted metal-dependent hydrolase